MLKVKGRAIVGVMVALAVMTMAAPGFLTAQAEEPIATVLDTSEVEDYLGMWRLTIDVRDNEIEMFLTFADVGGKLGATLDSARQQEALAISEIALAEEGGLDLNSELTFGGSFKIDINIKVKVDGDQLSGSIKDAGGIFSSDIVGERASQEELDGVQGRRPEPTEARMNIGGKRVRIAFANLETGSSDWDLFQQVEDGQVYTFTLSRATKMYTDFDLRFGDIVIEKENMAKDYPGVYSLWLKKTGDGWRLVFNSRSDIWGTRHEAELDVAEVPLQVSKIEGESQEKFLVKLEKGGEGGTLRMLWGYTQWSAPFSVSQ